MERPRRPTRGLEKVQRLDARLHMQDPEIGCIDKVKGGPSFDLDLAVLQPSMWSFGWIEKRVDLCWRSLLTFVDRSEKPDQTVEAGEWNAGQKKKEKTKKETRQASLGSSCYCVLLVGKIRGASL